jgi:hypothetical protein
VSPLDRVACSITAALALLAAVGIVRRRRVRACWSFAVYLAVTAAAFGLVSLAPGTFWTWPFYATTNALHAGLRVAIAFEVALQTLRPPLYAGRRRVRLLLSVILLGTLAAVVFYPRALRSAFDFTLLIESTSYGIGWMFGAFLLVVRYYRVPLDPLHRDVAAGFAILNLLVFYREALFALDPWFGLGTAAGRDLITKTLYPCLMAFWNVSAWRRDEATAFSPAVERLLQPWRTRR